MHLSLRLTKLYFGMLQISPRGLLWAVTFRWYEIPAVTTAWVAFPCRKCLSSAKNVYYFILLLFTGCMILLHRVLNSPFGSTSGPFGTIRSGVRRWGSTSEATSYLPWLLRLSFCRHGRGVVQSCGGRVGLSGACCSGSCRLKIFIMGAGRVVHECPGRELGAGSDPPCEPVQAPAPSTGR